MKTKMTTTLLAVFGAVALAASAQDNNPPGDGAPPADAPKHLQREGGPGGRSGIHILPPRAAEILKLTDDQKTQIAALEAETKAKLEKSLTPDQMKQLKSLRPPMRQGGAGGPGQGNGPGAGDSSMPPGPPPGEGGDNNGGPSGPPPGNQ